MPQLQDWSTWYYITVSILILGCGICVVGLLTLFEMIWTERKRRQLRKARQR